ncbi:acyltransferase family protein [Exiguobacterium flavidum]|uniref:acyltransferase family protein n=1 Tax=Exiguobacterium flavidum TaxID=2184695 RepID=UPI000DF7218D|nr:acyltransferase family protein [Exiguobacterium flavidum]
MIKEWNLLRILACVSIVFLHSMTLNKGQITAGNAEMFNFIRTLLCYGTPTFVVLSEMILANRYPLGLPSNFWKKRIQFIFLPFLAFGVVDALLDFKLSGMALPENLVNNLVFGMFEGYFVLVIFQFYLLHYLVTKLKLSMVWFLPAALLVTYVAMEITPMNLYDPHLMKVGFFSWIGFFAIAFVIGKHYDVIRETLQKHRLGVLFVFLTALVAFYISHTMIGYNTTVTSRRADLIPFVLSVAAMVIAWGGNIPYQGWMRTINDYSFGIYLLHWPILRVIGPKLVPLFESSVVSILVLFAVTLLATVTSIKLLSYLPFSAYLIGQTRRVYKKRPARPEAEQSAS